MVTDPRLLLPTVGWGRLRRGPVGGVGNVCGTCETAKAIVVAKLGSDRMTQRLWPFQGERN